MADDNDDPPRRLAERIMRDERDPPHVGRGEPYYPPSGAVQWLDEEDRERVENLIRMEPDIAEMVQARRSWALVMATLKTVAVWLTAMSGGLLVVREILKGLSK
ncbi:hypothetical protein ACLNGM_15215 [Aureimonas phyllosphaerae]|uniref:hypothetical protein n=1 Tax=Aureimonas phyllosphaerae TaxID=1166078 RepID=UPI003A5C03A6